MKDSSWEIKKRKILELIVRRRNTVLAVMVILCAFCAFLALRVPINADMTRYLPPDSPMKQGIDVMAEQFPDLAMPVTIRVMVPLTGDDTAPVYETLRAMEGVSGVDVRSDEEKGYTLFTVSTPWDYRTPEEFALEHGMKQQLAPYKAVVRNNDTMGMEIPAYIFVLAVVILLAVLFALSASWTEPFLFLTAIGMAIVMNMGTNLLLGSVSQTTYSMSAVLQLVLSMDYSIILMNRYRQEKAKSLEALAKSKNKSAGAGGISLAANAGSKGKKPAASPESGALREKAMSEALFQAFSSITGSGFTTLVGLTMLVFMHFRIGRDLGLVLAKGVFLSMLCVLLALPGLILLFDGAIERTRKAMLRIHTGALAAYSYRARHILLPGFCLLFALTMFLQGKAGVSYSLVADDPIAEIFPPENPVVLLFKNDEEESAARLAEQLADDPSVHSTYAYVTTLGKALTADEMADFLAEMSGSFAGMLPPDMAGAADTDLSALLPDAGTLRMLYGLYALQGAAGKNADEAAGTSGEDDGQQRLSLEQLIAFISKNLENPFIAGLVSDEQKEAMAQMDSLLAYAGSQLRGEDFSLMMISTDLPVESPQTESFVRSLADSCEEMFAGETYMIGNSVMNVEMKDGFARELLLITLLTAGAIFAVVAITFRLLVTALILVAVVQCGVFLTITTTWVIGYHMYYLAVIIVQCILMGATVDYGILFTNYYRETRREKNIKEALSESYERSMHTILTSSLFMIFVTGAIGFSPADPTITQICLSISLGALCALVLVVFVLPGLLAALDRFTGR